MGLFGKTSAVGIDLGHHYIRAVQVERSGRNWKVGRSISAPTPPETIKDGMVIDSKALGQYLKHVLKSAGISAGTAVISVAGGSVFVRPVAFPKMAESTLRKSIRFEAGRFIPGSVDDSMIEFEILDDIDEAQMQVLVVSAPKDIVNSRIAACNEAGLEVEIVDIEAFAMYRSLVEADAELLDCETIALVDVGGSGTTVSVINKGVFAMNRTISQGGQTLTDALKSYFKLDQSDAEEGKAQLDLTELAQDGELRENPPLRVIQPHIDDLIREVRRSLNYFQSQHSEGKENRKVEKVILSGGGTKLKGLDTYMAAKLNMPVVALGVFDNLRFTHSEAHDEKGLDLSIAVGLAMRSHAKAIAAKPSKAPKAVKPPKPGKPPKPPKGKRGSKAKGDEAIEPPPIIGSEEVAA